MKVKVETEKVGLKLNIQKMKITASGLYKIYYHCSHSAFVFSCLTFYNNHLLVVPVNAYIIFILNIQQYSIYTYLSACYASSTLLVSGETSPINTRFSSHGVYSGKVDRNK